MAPLPTLVLVHGAFHRASTWDLLIRELRDVDVRRVQLPSSAPVPIPQLGDMHDDAAMIADVVREVDGPVVICAHSYGSVPTSQGVAGLDQVKRIVYLNGFLLDQGESMLSLRGGRYPPHWGVHESEGYMEMLDPEQIFYNDLEPASARAAATALGPQSLTAMRQPLTRAAWHDIPSTYVIGELDAGLPPGVREMFGARLENVRRMRTSHSPFLSRPAETAALLREELADVTIARV